MLHPLVKCIRADVLEDNNGNELSDDQQEYFKITSQGIGTVFGLLFLYQLFAILEKGEIMKTKQIITIGTVCRCLETESAYYFVLAEESKDGIKYLPCVAKKRFSFIS